MLRVSGARAASPAHERDEDESMNLATTEVDLEGRNR